MDQGTIKQFFGLLRSAICGTKPDNESFSREQLFEMISVSKKHDILHLLEMGLKQGCSSSADVVISDNSILNAAYRYEQTKYELDILCEALESAEISHIPLKGAVMCRYYPEEWMRTSCDIDILIKEKDVDKAVSLLTDKYGYTFHKRGSHDVSLFTPNQKHIELHFSLVEVGVANKSSAVLNNVWKTAHVCENYRCQYEMSDEMFYFYHIAHMAKHFENGGCGVRQFIDLWLLDNIKDFDLHKRDTLLEQGGLLRFAQVSRRLSTVWFEGAEKDTISEQLEQYILNGSVYGTKENRVAVQRQKKGGRIKFALYKIFIPYDELVLHYPIVKKYRCLTPVMHICRWFKLVFGGHFAQVSDELKYIHTVSEDKTEEITILLNNVGLNQ